MPRRPKPEPLATTPALPAGVTVSHYAPGKARVTYTATDGTRTREDCAPEDVAEAAARLAGA